MKFARKSVGSVTVICHFKLSTAVKISARRHFINERTLSQLPFQDKISLFL